MVRAFGNGKENKMRKNVWILNHYAGNTFFEKGGRHYWFAKFLKKKGYLPLVFCSNAKHNSNGELYFHDTSLYVESIASEIEVPFIFIKSRPYKSNGLDRILNMVDFYRNVKKSAKGIAKTHGTPDVIFTSSVHPLTLWAGIKMAKKYGVKCICEVRDLWPESLVAYGLLDEKSIITKLMRAFEKRIYKKADAIVFTMEGGYDYIIEQGWEKDISKEKVYYINNGVDLTSFDDNKLKAPFADEDLDNKDNFNIVYAGSIRKVNDLGIVLDVAQNVNTPNVRFLIWGTGDELPALEARVKDEGISNVVFKGKVDKIFIPSIISKADMNYAHNGQSDMLYYGISFNKVFEYFAAGKPILCDFNSKYNPVIQENAGITVECADPMCIAQAIDSFCSMDESVKQEYGENARASAVKYDFSVLTNYIDSIIQSLTGI